MTDIRKALERMLEVRDMRENIYERKLPYDKEFRQLRANDQQQKQAEKAARAAIAAQPDPDQEFCPICTVPFANGDVLATDIDMGACHAACLHGSPTVDLETGEPISGPIPTYKFEALAAPASGGWRPIAEAPQDQAVILCTTGGHVGEALMLIDQDTGEQKWTWAHGPVHPNHKPLGWISFPPALAEGDAS